MLPLAFKKMAIPFRIHNAFDAHFDAHSHLHSRAHAHTYTGTDTHAYADGRNRSMSEMSAKRRIEIGSRG